MRIGQSMIIRGPGAPGGRCAFCDRATALAMRRSATVSVFRFNQGSGSGVTRRVTASGDQSRSRNPHLEGSGYSNFGFGGTANSKLFAFQLP